MTMLNKEIQEFITEMRELGEIGCMLVPRAGAAKLISALKRADVMIGKNVVPGRVTFYEVMPKFNFRKVVKPAILVVIEEDYSKDTTFQEQVRERAAYFINIEG